jgi:ribonuclease VapC
MVIGTSALVAILRGEAEADAFMLAIEHDPVRLMSAATLVEATIVIEGRRGESAVRDLDLLLHRAGFVTVPMTPEHAEIARQARRRFGTGRHPAALNYGDCFAYALSKQYGEPLLFKGEDFSRTDVVGVRWT